MKLVVYFYSYYWGMIMIWNENAQSIELYDVIIYVIFYVVFDFV